MPSSNTTNAAKSYVETILSYLGHTPTPDQAKATVMLADFLILKSSSKLFVLKGYAGTGKTSMISALIKSLPGLGYKSVLMAPTGRAAKVLSNYSGHQASTIHRKIYSLANDGQGKSYFSRQENKHKNTLFIVDEASMIGSGYNELSTNGLLDDLFLYINSGINCSLIFIGDTAQLPPVGSSQSPALNEDYLRSAYSLDVFVSELKQIVRQQKESGILVNATEIRDRISSEKTEWPHLKTSAYKDIFKMTGEKLEDGLNYAYNKNGVEDSIVICKSNKDANLFNQQIRNRIFYRDEELNAGDYIMVVKNNYYWLDKDSKAGFIANGDIAEILRVKGIHEQYGFKFAECRIRLIDYPEMEAFDAMVILDTLTSESPALTNEQQKNFFEAVLLDFEEIKNKGSKMKALKESRYFNALQIKFAYAITCHKSQGGQWKSVFVNQGYLTEERMDKEFLRWLYTAVTRASDELFMVNFHQKFFE